MQWEIVHKNDQGIRDYYALDDFDPRGLPDPSPAFIRAARRIPNLRFLTGFTAHSFGEHFRKQFSWEANNNDTTQHDRK